MKQYSWLRKSICFSLLSFTFFLFFISSPITAYSSEVNYYEKIILRNQIQSRIKELIQYWQEELYANLYNMNYIKQKKNLPKNEFVQRLIDQEWKPESTKKIKLTNWNILYRNFASFSLQLSLQNKVDPGEKLEKIIHFTAVYESNNWYFDINQLINVPFLGVTVKKIQSKTNNQTIKKKVSTQPKKTTQTEQTPTSKIAVPNKTIPTTP